MEPLKLPLLNTNAVVSKLLYLNTCYCSTWLIKPCTEIHQGKDISDDILSETRLKLYNADR